MRNLSRRTFLGLGVGAVAWACARPQDEGTAPEPPGPEDRDLLSLVVTVPEVAVGDRRMAVTLLDGQRPVPLGDIDLTLTVRGPEEGPISVEPRLESIRFGVGGEDLHADHDHEHDDEHRILVFEHPFQTPGFWRVEAEISGGDERRHAEAAFEVVDRSPTVMVGEPAIVVPSPTVGDPLDADPVCTRRPPCSMHERSVADAVQGGTPSVLVFATPAFCTSRVCGPLVDVLEGVRREVGDGAAFVHVEVWTDSGSVGDWPDGLVGAFREWGFHNEPWTFFVDAEGIVRMRWGGPAGFNETLRATEDLIAGRL